MEKVKVGVLGVGHLGRLHASLYRQVQNAELVGIYDTDSEKLQQTAQEYQLPAMSSAEELFSKADAVNIVTPTTHHFENAMQALDAGCHIFLEKPITATVEEADKLIEKANALGKVLQVGHIERFNPAIMALEDVQMNPLFIESHRLASFNPRGTDVAVILDLMIHDLDLLLAMVKSKPVQIDASGVGVISDNIDIANARIQFENGCVANVTASRISAKKMRKMRIFQQNAYISLDFVDGFSEIYYIPQADQQPFHDGTLAFSLGEIMTGSMKKEIKYNKLQRSGINPLKQELNSFVDCITMSIPPVVSGEAGREALKLANQVLEKIKQHTTIVSERNTN